MSPTTGGRSPARATLTSDAVVDGAMVLADRTGIERLTIRRLADHLGVKPMTIYHHIDGKEAIIDGMVDRVFGEIDLPPTDVDWRTAMGHRSRSARTVLARHPWAVPLMESRATPGPHTLRHHDAVLGCFRRGGFSVAMTAHAYALVDSYVYGFALQEASLPATGGEDLADLIGSLTEVMPAGEYPHLAELTLDHALRPGYDFSTEFDFGLELILDGLAAAVE